MIARLALRLAAPALLLTLAVSARADDTAYTIKLHRPDKVGEKFAATEKASVDQKAVVTGAVSNSKAEQHAGELEATEETMAVDNDGNASAVHVVINKLTASDNGAAAKEVLPAGSEIDVAFKDKTVEFTQKDGEVSADAKQALSLFFRPHTTDESDDVMFGTKDKQKVGATWKPNFKKMAEDMGNGAFQMDPAKMTGEVKLVSVKDVKGVAMMTLTATLESTDLTTAALGKAKEAKIKADLTSQIPADPADTSSSVSKMSTVFHAVFDLPNGSTVTSDVTDTREGTLVKIK